MLSAQILLVPLGVILVLVVALLWTRRERRALEQANRANQAKTEALLRALPDLMFIHDRYGHYLEYYAPIDEPPFTSPETFLGKRFQEILPADVAARVTPAFERVIATGEPATIEYELPMPAGVVSYEARMVPFGPDRVLTVVRNTTAEKHAERDLEASRRFTERLTEMVPNVVYVYDLNERRNVYVNHSTEAVLGYTPDEVIKMGDRFVERVAHPDDLLVLEEQDYSTVSDGQVLKHLFRLRHKDGTWRWISRSAMVFARDAEGRPTQILGSGIDVTTLKTAEDELRSLSARLRDSQDDERRRIARELHDGVAQSLFGVATLLAKVHNQMDTGNPTKTTLADCLALCDESLRELRLLSYVLHPPLLDEVGLTAALKWFAEGLERRSGIAIEVLARESPKRLPPSIERDLFRIAQEGLNNVVRHSGSPNAVVHLTHGDDGAVLCIRDFGRGLSSDHTAGGRSHPGVGILGIRERLRHVGGQLTIDSGSDGTTLTATVPLITRAGITRGTKHA